jgi:hypothetical protein
MAYFLYYLGNIEGKTVTKYYVNLAIGAFTQICPVHPNFRLIQHLPISQLDRTQTPFLDRHEKYPLGVEQASFFFFLQPIIIFRFTTTFYQDTKMEL